MIKCERPSHFFILGDSLAAGIGASTYAKSASGLIAGHVQKAYGTPHLSNFGISGADAVRIEQNEVRRIGPAACAAVLLIAGANDVQEYHTPGRFERDYAGLLRAIRKKVPNALVVVTGLPDISLSPRIPPIAKPAIAYLSRHDNAAIARAAGDAKAAFVDLYPLSETAARSGRVYLSADHLHPNDDGYALIAQAVNARVDREFANAVQK